MLPSRHGGWEVTVPDCDERVACTTLHEATMVADREVTDRLACELIVYDAYHRVLRRESPRRAAA